MLPLCSYIYFHASQANTHRPKLEKDYAYLTSLTNRKPLALTEPIQKAGFRVLKIV